MSAIPARRPSPSSMRAASTARRTRRCSMRSPRNSYCKGFLMHASLPDANTLIARLADAIAPTLAPDTLVVGIHTGGVWVAERLHALLQCTLPLGTLDISFYRDDFSRIGLHPQVKPSNLPFDLEGRAILLVDDVLYTGRTIRAAMNELFDYGRPASIRLAALVDRGGRELPISAQFLGAQVKVTSGQSIELQRDAAGQLRLIMHEENR